MKRCALADVIVLFKEYPHTDFAERGEEVVDLVLRTIRGEIKPVKSVFDCRMIASFPTSIQPMRGLVDRIMALEGKDRVLSVSIGHCFPYGDVPECGARILVITDDAKPHGDRLAEEIGRELIALREQAAPPEYSVDGAIDSALAQSGRPGRDRRHHRQCRRRRALRQHHLPASPDRARRAGRGGRADLGPDRGAARVRRGRRRAAAVPLRRQDRECRPARRSMPRSR